MVLSQEESKTKDCIDEALGGDKVNDQSDPKTTNTILKSARLRADFNAFGYKIAECNEQRKQGCEYQAMISWVTAVRSYPCWVE